MDNLQKSDGPKNTQGSVKTDSSKNPVPLNDIEKVLIGVMKSYGNKQDELRKELEKELAKEKEADNRDPPCLKLVLPYFQEWLEIQHVHKTLAGKDQGNPANELAKRCAELNNSLNGLLNQPGDKENSSDYFKGFIQWLIAQVKKLSDKCVTKPEANS